MNDEIEEIDFEPEDELGDIGALQAKMKKIRAELAEVKKERQEYLDGWQRCKADAANGAREASAASIRASARGRESFAEDIIPVLDSFDMATLSEQWATVDDGWRSGMEHVKNQLIDALARNGITRFGSIGDIFDPTLHEAVGQEESGAHKEGEIVRILRFGYKTSERLIRPAQGIVFHAAHGADED